MIIYIDSSNKCHTENSGSMTPVETDFFVGKCKAYIEGYKCFPNDGMLLYPFIDVQILDILQSQYEELLADAERFYSKGVNSI